MWNLRQNLESSGHGSIYHVHFAWQVWHGQLSPRFKFNKLKSFSGVEIDQNHVDKRILGGKGFAVGRLKRHNFCPASVYIYICIYMVTVCHSMCMHIDILYTSSILYQRINGNKVERIESICIYIIPVVSESREALADLWKWKQWP